MTTRTGTQVQTSTHLGQYTFNDQERANATRISTMQSSLSSTTADNQYEQNYTSLSLLGHPSSRQSENDSHALNSTWSQTFTSGPHNYQSWQDGVEWGGAPHMFQRTQNFTIQGDSTFNDIQGHVDATCAALMRPSLALTAADSRYQLHRIHPATRVWNKAAAFHTPRQLT
ncbi:hypothetical protein FA15DRAFT_356464 [Coprinopsis marcescibilis]|uniref:Uncharacterized protein n=1 Tax=Coprinopsis marcescibilis TaxID=230819 RepID=A0A5C3KC11_COPMA|nr:hypothetical protein FA15DRAFT_356464 [Coprinopsis marcescibilis]